MKKLFIAIIAMMTSIVFAENILSLNVSPVGASNHKGKYEQTDMELREYYLSLSPEYNYIFKNNLMLGAMFGFGMRIITDTRNDSTIFYPASEIHFAPTIGARFGKRNLFTLSVIPTSFGITYIDGAWANVKIGNVVNKVDIDYEATEFSIKSGVQMNFQWGSKLCRNGFFVGLYIPWYRNIYDVSGWGIEGSDRELFTAGFDISLGYRLSFVM